MQYTSYVEIISYYEKGAVKLVDLEYFAVYKDAYYLGKLIGDLISMFIGVVGTVQGIEKVIAGGVWQELEWLLHQEQLEYHW